VPESGNLCYLLKGLHPGTAMTSPVRPLALPLVQKLIRCEVSPKLPTRFGARSTVIRRGWEVHAEKLGMAASRSPVFRWSDEGPTCGLRIDA